MQLFDRIYSYLKNRQINLLNGGVNCIPLGLPRFESELPGVEQKRIDYITANSKVGKTQLTDFLYLYNPLFYIFDNPNLGIDLKILYFTLEMSQEQKYQQFICHLLFRLSKGRIRISPTDLRSTSKEKPLSDEILEIMKSEEYQKYFKFFEEKVTFIDSIRNPTGIFHICKDYARSHGTQYKKTIQIRDSKTKEVFDKEVDDYYIANNPKEYVIIIVDHMSLLQAESGGTTREAMVLLSSKYFVELRNKYNYTIAGVIQQASAQESNENLKLGKLRPTPDGLGEAKICQRDCDVMLGLFSPHRHSIKEYLRYNIEEFGDNIRFLELIMGREGGGGTICPLFFDGAVNYFQELPLPGNQILMGPIITLLNRVRNNKIILLAIKIFIKNGKNSNIIGAIRLRKK